jgi:hypothetical protein
LGARRRPRTPPRAPGPRQLIGEAERLAAAILGEAAWEPVRDDVKHALLSLPLEALGDRAGYHPGLGYIHECDAAGEIVDEALAGHIRAHQVAAGVLDALPAPSAANARRQITDELTASLARLRRVESGYGYWDQ